MKTESQTTHDWERSAHALEWATAIAFSQGIGRLSRPPPVPLIQRLLDVYVTFTDGTLEMYVKGVRWNMDPSGDFRRARPAAMALRAALDHWDGSIPPPSAVTMAAREMVTAYGHPAAGQWETQNFADDAEEALLWPDEPITIATTK